MQSKELKIQLKIRRDQILREVERQITIFDENITELQKRRLQIEYETKFLECHMLSLHQELWIIKDSQQISERVLNEQNRINEEKQKISLNILSHKNQIQGNHINIESILTEIEQIDRMFQTECTRDKKFDMFLRKIYRKKEMLKDEICDGNLSEKVAVNRSNLL